MKRHRWNESKTTCLRCGQKSKFIKRKKIRLTGDPNVKHTFDRMYLVKGKLVAHPPVCKGKKS